MQKKLIALAIAGMVAAPAFAADNVTVYGVMGAYFQSSKTDTNTAGVVASTNVATINTGGQSGSRLGFKGSEDLGGGLKANFLIESQLNTDASGNSAASGVIDLGNRQTYVGLSGNWGAFSLGRQYSAEFYNMAVHADIDGYADWSALLGAGFAATTRVSNSMVYASPSMSGFSGRVQFGLSEAAVAPKNAGQSLGLNLDYANGPMWVGLGYMNVNADTATLSGNNKWTSLGASYDFGMAKVSGSFQHKTWGNATAATATQVARLRDAKESGWQIGANFVAGPNGNVLIQYATRNDKQTLDQDSKAWMLEYSHKLSKRTNLVAAVQRIDQSGAGGIQVDNNKYVGGIRHTF